MSKEFKGKINFGYEIHETRKTITYLKKIKHASPAYRAMKLFNDISTEISRKKTFINNCDIMFLLKLSDYRKKILNKIYI